MLKKFPKWLVLSVLGVVPIVISLVNALRGGAILVGDRAVFALLVKDAATGSFPSVGQYSWHGWNHPGALIFYVFAPFHRFQFYRPARRLRGRQRGRSPGLDERAGEDHARGRACASRIETLSGGGLRRHRPVARRHHAAHPEGYADRRQISQLQERTLGPALTRILCIARAIVKVVDAVQEKVVASAPPEEWREEPTSEALARTSGNETGQERKSCVDP
mgnify:CR=1 FL=1